MKIGSEKIGIADPSVVEAPNIRGGVCNTGGDCRVGFCGGDNDCARTSKLEDMTTAMIIEARRKYSVRKLYRPSYVKLNSGLMKQLVQDVIVMRNI